MSGYEGSEEDADKLYSLCEEDDPDIYEVVELLDSTKVSPNHSSFPPFTPLHEACKNKNPMLVEVLAKYGADLEADGEGRTPLQCACESVSVECVRAMIFSGCEVNIEDDGYDSNPGNPKRTIQDVRLRINRFKTSHSRANDEKKLKKCDEIEKILEKYSKFNEEMNVKMLAGWLRKNNVEEKHIQVLEVQDIDGDCFVKLPRDVDAMKAKFPDLTVGGASKFRTLIKKALSELEGNAQSSSSTDSERTATASGVYILTSKDIQQVKKAIWGTRHQWKDVGRAMDIDDDTIRTIRGAKDGDCLHELLREWIHTGEATIPHLLEALEDPTVGRGDIAVEIRRRKDHPFK